MAQEPEPPSTTDWVSAISSVIAVAFAVLAVATVYVAARQLLSERREYKLGLSLDALGPWQTKVRTRRLVGLKIATPLISMPVLLQQNWDPELSWPAGFAGLEDPSAIGSSDSEKVPVKASWVNFLQALGIQSTDQSLYRMQDQSALVSGIVPMRWAGKDLVSVCAILGFQSCEDDPGPSYKRPMPLPMQWIGPPGWLQFRQSAEGCVAEFRRRAWVDKRLPLKIHEFYATLPRTREPGTFHARLWWSVHGILMKGGKALYLGGLDDRKCLDCGATVFAGEAENHSRRVQNQKANKVTATDDLFTKLLGSENPGESTTRWLNSTQPESATGCRTKQSKEMDFLCKPLTSPNKKKGTLMVMCPNLDGLASHFDAELADSRGLNLQDCYDYARVLVEDPIEVHDKFAYQLGDMHMDRTLLGLFKEAMALFKPDGYYFAPTKRLARDMDFIFEPVLLLLDRVDAQRFRRFELDDPSWPNSCPSKHRAYLHHAMLLCNELQGFRHTSFLSTDDTALLRKASYTLRETIRTHPDLVWAMLVCPQLYEDLAEFFYKMECLDVLGTLVSCTGEVLDCSRLLVPNQTVNSARTYTAPLCGEGRFSGTELLAAFMDLTITGFWVSIRWTSDVGMYDTVIPPTVTMC